MFYTEVKTAKVKETHDMSAILRLKLSSVETEKI